LFAPSGLCRPTKTFSATTPVASHPDRRRKRPTSSLFIFPNTTSRGGHPARETFCAHAHISQSPYLPAPCCTLVIWARYRLERRTREIATPRTAPRSFAPDLYNDAPHAALELERCGKHSSYGFTRRAYTTHVPRLRHNRSPETCATPKTSLMAYTTLHAGSRELPVVGK